MGEGERSLRWKTKRLQEQRNINGPRQACDIRHMVKSSNDEKSQVTTGSNVYDEHAEMTLALPCLQSEERRRKRKTKRKGEREKETRRRTKRERRFCLFTQLLWYINEVLLFAAEYSKLNHA